MTGQIQYIAQTSSKQCYNKRRIQINVFLFFSTKSYVVGTQQKPFDHNDDDLMF